MAMDRITPVSKPLILKGEVWPVVWSVDAVIEEIYTLDLAASKKQSQDA